MWGDQVRHPAQVPGTPGTHKSRALHTKVPGNSSTSPASQPSPGTPHKSRALQHKSRATPAQVRASSTSPGHSSTSPGHSHKSTSPGHSSTVPASSTSPGHSHKSGNSSTSPGTQHKFPAPVTKSRLHTSPPALSTSPGTPPADQKQTPDHNSYKAEKASNEETNILEKGISSNLQQNVGLLMAAAVVLLAAIISFHYLND
ncbi:hypothetical protein GDO81_017968 [Engystomops pustulosus]|uniref:Uncharacterized protein n=1 Tax=Engystomops pustulosus TaxID=76066 RepID=A0AAV7A8Q1_ENGPU|nr:hypothetical protein GDO81_017968 [Engystomops pustulosus]